MHLTNINTRTYIHPHSYPRTQLFLGVKKPLIKEKRNGGKLQVVSILIFATNLLWTNGNETSLKMHNS